MDVTELLSALIRFDTSNYGGGRSAGERDCAEWIADLLREAGWEPQLWHRDDAPDRVSVSLRVPGTEPDLPGLLVHAHTDVVPVETDDWSVPPFEGIIRDGYVWGRGANDMLDTVAVLLHTLLRWGRDGTRPRRDVLFLFVADEEDAGQWGAHWLVDEHPELFAGLEVAIGESGAVCELLPTADGGLARVYTINAGERGTQHIRLTAQGTSGHGSRPSGDDAVHRVLHALVRIADHEWPLTMSNVVQGHYQGLSAALGVPIDFDDEASLLRLVDWLGPQAGPLRYILRPSSTPTVLRAGYKVNVVPGLAVAEVDVRCPPGTEDFVHDTLGELVGDQVSYEYITRGAPLEAPTEGPFWDAMVASILAHDPQAVVIGGCMGGGTDNKAFARLGMDTYGFTPAPADPEGRVAAGYHGVDERVPVASLRGATQMMHDFLHTV
ncbi:M20/M25/M40 family metallo-hydrolase [Propionibacteriaceae bacterium Y1923]|uniref:M20/M25/M40 family metallo-hydrolase n=1 Tax=Aestuariimicrobium sp. Y1814 TaxID=3418742 RepID=UPI003C19B619